MSSHPQKLGTNGEMLAAQFLVSHGYRLLARNLKSRYGEIDILATDGNCLVIVEVKAKISEALGAPAEMITLRKQQKLRLLASTTAARYQTDKYRIDAIVIDFSFTPAKLDHLQSII